MTMIDNYPISKSAIGRLVTIDHELGQFVDNCLYVLPSDIYITEKSIEDFFESAFNIYDVHKYLNLYDYEVLGEIPNFKIRNELIKAIEEEQSNFLLPLYTPNISSKQYLILRSDEENLTNNLGLLFYTAERISTFSMREVVYKYSLNNADSVISIIKNTYNSKQFWKGYISNIGLSLFEPSFHAIAEIPPGRNILDIDGVITYRKKKKMMDRMEDNLRKYKKNKDPRAEAELSVIFKTIDTETLIEICSKLPKKQIEMVCNTVNPQRLAEQSCLKLSINIVDKKYRKGNDGIYRLFFEKNNKSVAVHFKRKESFILYLIYILDKYNNESIDTLDIKKYKDQFVKLFDMNYSGRYGELSYEKIVNNDQQKTDVKQPVQLKLCYSDIRMTISAVCEQLQESHLPYIIKTPQDHISVLKSNILIPQEILDLVR